MTQRQIAVLVLALVFAVLVSCAGVTALVVFMLGKARTVAQDVIAANNRVEKVDLAQLLAAWDKNPMAVIEQYKAVDIELTGFVVEISSNLHRQVYVSVSPSSQPESKRHAIQVFLLDDSLKSQMKGFPLGSKITVHVLIGSDPIGPRARCLKII
jgi:hypothetical protein